MARIKSSIMFSIITISSFFLTIPFAFAEERECLNLQEYVSEGVGNNFLLMGALKTIAQSCASVATRSWAAFASSLQEIIVIGAAIYIAVSTLKLIGSFSQQDTTGYLSKERTGIIPVLAKTGVIVLLLTDDGNSFLYSNLISPVVGASMNVGSYLGDTGLGSDFSSASNVSSLFDSVILKIKEFNQSSYQIVALGRNLICLTFLPASFLKNVWSLLPFGTVLYIFGWLICIGVAFSMLDILFRLAVGCIILPFAIACGFSKLTSGYSKKTWGLFVNACFSFILLGVTVSFALEMLSFAITGSGDLKATLESQVFEKVEQVEDLADSMQPGAFFLTFLCCLLMFRIFSEVEQTANTLSGAKPVGSTGKKAFTPFVRGAGKAAGKLVTEPIKATTKTASDSIINSKPMLSARAAVSNVKMNVKTNVKKFFGLND